MKKRLFITALVALVAVATAGPSGARQASADVVGSATQALGPLANLDITTLIPAGDPALTDPAASDPATTDPAHLPRGGNYKLFGNAANRLDPLNPFNEVISFDTRPQVTDPTAAAGAFRKLGDHVQVGMLTDMVELKYYLVGRTCGGGSPRIQLGISLNGDGKFDHNAFGYTGDKPFGGGCLMNQWVYEDMTDNAPKWDLSKFTPLPTCDMTCTWAQMVTYFNTTYPNHEVLDAVLVDDGVASGFAAGAGCAYFDLVSSGPLTLTDHSDTTGDGSGPNNCP